MRTLSAMACVLSLAGCATPASRSEIDSANDAAFVCMQHAEPILDDRTSDAITIAYGIVAKCTVEITHAADVIAQGDGLELRQYTRRKINEASLKLATEIVLKERTQRARGSQ